MASGDLSCVACPPARSKSSRMLGDKVVRPGELIMLARRSWTLDALEAVLATTSTGHATGPPALGVPIASLGDARRMSASASAEMSVADDDFEAWPSAAVAFSDMGAGLCRCTRAV